MGLTTFYIVFVIELLCLLGFWWFATKLRYFASIFITSAVLLPAFYLFFAYFSKSEPALVNNPAAQFLSPYWAKFLPLAVIKVLPLLLASSVVLFLLFFFVYRPLASRVNEFFFKKKARILHDKRGEGIHKIEVNASKYITNEGQYFIGTARNKKATYLNESDLTTHMQVVGPSGTGKTVSVLFPLAVQALLKNKSLIFVDGKGDSKLKQALQTFCQGKGIKMKFFDPLQPEYSHTYNPLISSTDPNEIMNLLATGLNLNAPGEAKVYTDIQKKFLATLLHLFMQTKRNFNFVDLVEFINHEDSRQIAYSFIDDEFYKQEMALFLARLSKNQRELIGLTTVLDQLFVSDEKISELINTYEPDINIRQTLREGGAILFSFSAGMKALTNEALAKMVLADISNSVGERHASPDKNPGFGMLILDEFGQYVPDTFDKFISTARSANVACILSHQTNAQLETYFSRDRLARVVRENTAAKLVLRQSEEASFWSECFGTKEAMKRTDQVEAGPMLTEKLSEMSSLREVDEFIIHPNVLRTLQVGQAVFKFKDNQPQILNLGRYAVNGKLNLQTITHKTANGLNLRQRRLENLKKLEQERGPETKRQPATPSKRKRIFVG